MKLRSKIFLVIIIVFVAIIAGVSYENSAYAADYTSVLDKWLYTGYYQCLISNNTESSIKTMKESHSVIGDVFQNSGGISLPSYGLAGNAASVNCLEIAIGKSGLVAPFSNGVLKPYSTITWRDKSSSESLMTNTLKYKKLESGASGSEGESSFRIVATRSSVTTFYSALDFLLGGPQESTHETEVGTVTITSKPNSSGGRTYSYNDNITNFFSDLQVSLSNGKLTLKVNVPLGCIGEDFSVEIPLKQSTEEFYEDVKQALANRSASYVCVMSDTNGLSSSETKNTFSFSLDEKNIGIVDSTTAIGYEKQDTTPLESLKAVSSYTNITMSGNNGLRFSPTDYYNLYSYYLSKAAVSSGSTENVITCNPTSTNNLTPVKLLDSEGQPNANCYVNLNGVDPSTLNVYTQGYDAANKTPTIELITLQKAIDWLNNEANFALINASEVNDITNLGTINGPTTPSELEKTADCYSGGGPLGWIMCPVLEVVGLATEAIYNEWIEPALEIQAGEIFDHDKGVYGGWSAFRNFANIIFAILFLVVIFSQVTGFGLDNYGIKKILPRLIMVAVLVNISYILCQLAVDVSNLLGVGLKDLFNNNLPVTLVGQDGLFSGAAKTVAGGLFVSALSFVGLGAATVKLAVITAPVALQGMAWIIAMLLITFIGCLFSVIFFLITLAVRQAGVIMLVVLSPVAIVCYALPNTKGFFDKWKKLFQALLVVYPICGILMGGGNYAGSILLSIGRNTAFGALGTFYTLTAMLVTVVPFFFIPSILRTSLLAMGNLGMKISNFGKRLGNGVGGLVRGSQGYQELLKSRKIALNQARMDAIDKSFNPNGLGNRIRRRVPFLKEKTGLSRGKSLARNRYATENRRLLEEYAVAEANAKRPAMEYGNDEFNSVVENTRASNILKGASALESVYSVDGTADDPSKLEEIMLKAINDVTDDFSNEAARSRLLAASKMLVNGGEDGHIGAQSAIHRAEFGIDPTDTKRLGAYKKAMQWLSKIELDRSGTTLKRETPILNGMFKRLQQGLIANDTREVDLGGGRKQYTSLSDVMAGLRKVTPDVMPGVDENELAQARDIVHEAKRIREERETLLNSGTREEDLPDYLQLKPDYDTLATHLEGAASQVFSNEQIAKNVKPKEGAIIQNLLNYDINHGIYSPSTVERVNVSDLSRIESGINRGMISGDEKESILTTLEAGILHATQAADGKFNGMSADKAKIIDRILRQNQHADYIGRRGIDQGRYQALLDQGETTYINHNNRRRKRQ